jgi:restriction system protein
MARRRRKDAGDAAGLIVLLVVVGVPAVAIFAALSVLAHNPLLLVLLLGGGTGLLIWRSGARHKRWQALQEARRREAEIYAARAQAIESYHAMSAREFEEALAWLCHRDGCSEAFVTGKAGDLGADVKAITPDGRVLIIQAKRYVIGNMVTGPDLQKFGGTCYTVHGAQIAAVVTTSGFTRQAREYAAAAGIALFDHDSLAGWVARNGPPPWLAVPAPPVPVVPAGQEPRGRHSRPGPGAQLLQQRQPERHRDQYRAEI